MTGPLIAFVFVGILNLDYLFTFTAITYIGVILVLFYSSKNNPIKFPKYLLFLLLFLLYQYYSTFYILDREFKMLYLVSNDLVGSIFLLFIVENIQINKLFFDRVFKISKVIIVAAIIVIFIQQTFNPHFLMRPGTTDILDKFKGNEMRLHSIYSWVGDLSNGFSFVPVFLIIVETLNKKKKHKKVLIWILFGIIFAVLTRARWALVNAFMVFFVVIITQQEKFKAFLKYLFIIPSILIMGYFTMEVVGIDAEGIVKERILETDKKNVQNSSAGTRLLAVYAFNKFYWKNAIFGKGNIKYGMGGTNKQDYQLKKFLAGRSSQIHVGYLSLFYIYGLIGGLFFLMFLYTFTRKFYRDAKKTKYWAPFFGILGLTLANITLVYLSFFEFGLVFAVIANKFYVNQYEKRLALNPVNS